MALKRRISIRLGWVGLCLACTGAWAQSGNGLDNPDWKEAQTPPPPAFAKDQVIALDMPPFVSLKVGVDPSTIVVGDDGVVRYVIVMTNATGSVNAVYEGIRCITDEVKTYARWTSSGTWSLVSDPQWKALNDNMPSQHAKAFARQGGCQSRLATSKNEILRALKSVKKNSNAAISL
jgi:CNP1-like family